MKTTSLFATALCPLLLAACAQPAVIGKSDSRPASDGAAGPPDAATASRDASPSAAASCQTLVLTFVGCDVERLNECEREYAAVSVSAKGAVDRSVDCLKTSFASVAAARWPAKGAACNPTAVPPLLDVWEQWFHGTCQAANGGAENSVDTDPGFPVCRDSALPGCLGIAVDGGTAPECFFDLPSCGGTL